MSYNQILHGCLCIFFLSQRTPWWKTRDLCWDLDSLHPNVPKSNVTRKGKMSLKIIIQIKQIVPLPLQQKLTRSPSKPVAGDFVLPLILAFKLTSLRTLTRELINAHQEINSISKPSPAGERILISMIRISTNIDDCTTFFNYQILTKNKLSSGPLFPSGFNI